MGREGHCRQMSLACVGSTRSVLATLGLPPLTGVCFPRLHCSGSRLLYMERALRCVRFQFSGPPQNRRFGCACVLCLPRPSSPGSQGLDGRPLPGAVRLLPPRSQPQLPCALVGCVRLVCVLGNWPLAATLPVDVDHPESQEVFGEKLQACLQFGRGCCLCGSRSKS